MLEILTDWTTLNADTGVTVMYFDDATPVADARLALSTLWADIDAVLHEGTNWTIRQDGRVIAEATGTLTGTWFASTPYTGTGQSAGNPVGNATQMLLRWQTGVIVSGRRVAGRTFVPGLASGSTSGGQMRSEATVTVNTACETFTNATSGFGVWHRPKPAQAGSHHVATAGNVWSELAVQRGRR